MVKKFNREFEWEQFSNLVQEHIVNYTIPQYGDAPNDQLEDFSVADCMTSIRRYANRAGKGQRGTKEEMRDCLKIAHYAAASYFKLLMENVPKVGGE